MKERVQRIVTDRDVIAASRAGLALGRHAGLSLRDQFCIAGLVGELGRALVARSEPAVCVIRDESGQSGSRLRLLFKGAGGGLPDMARELSADEGPLPRWLRAWPRREVDLTSDGDALCLTVAICR